MTDTQYDRAPGDRPVFAHIEGTSSVVTVYTIGLVLAVVAFVLARSSRGLLLGEAATPKALAAIKQAIDRGQDMALADACMYEAALFGNIAATADAKEGAGAFLEKRAPTWTGH